ncbi:MAG: discoidin domain-containing protein [Candidatus Hydrogenedentota bacterium]
MSWICALCLLPFADVAFANAAVVLPVPFSVSGNGRELASIHDGDFSTAARPDSSPLQLFLLLQNEAVLKGVELECQGAPARVTVSLSKDAVSWSQPTVAPSMTPDGKRTSLEFAPSVARAAMVTIEFSDPDFQVSELRLIPADASTAEVYAIETAEIEEKSAVIRWKTTMPVKTSILYGLNADRMKSQSAPSYEMVMDHEARLENLMPGSDYHVWILTAEDLGSSDSKPLKFRTKGSPYPFTWNPRYILGRDSALFRFSANVPCRAWMEWREAGGDRLMKTAARVEENTLSFVADFGGLLPRTAYEYQIVTEDSAGHGTATPWFRFTTFANNIAVGARAWGSFALLTDEQYVESKRPALERITDGRNDYFTGMATSSDPADTDQWVLVDLGSEKLLTSVETVWRGNAYPKSYYVMVARDTVNWSYPGFGIDAGAGADERSTRGDPLKRVAIAVDASMPIRYLMIFIPKGSPYFTKTPAWRFVQLAELEAHEVWTAVDTKVASTQIGIGR